MVFDKTQGITAYNDLFDISSHKTTYLKFSEGENLELSFIDAVEDFHITISGLQYDKNQLKAFKDSLPQNKPFAFLLGLDNTNKNGRPIILSTRQEFEILNLAGYIE